MPPALKRRLSNEVVARSSSLNDVALDILARSFDVPFLPSGRRGAVPGGSGVVILRMPDELKRKIQAEAYARESNTNDVILRTLAESLGVPYEPSARRTVPFGGGRGKEAMASKNGKVHRSEDKVRVAIIGVGNCANSLLQGVEYYKDADPEHFVPGLMHVDLGGYHISRHRVHGGLRRRQGRRSASTSPTRSGRTRTTRSSSPTCRRRASRSRAA